MASTSSPADLLHGVAYVWRGFKFIRENRDLARYWRPPIVIVAAALVLSLWLAGSYHDELLAWLWPVPVATDWFSRLLTILHSALEAVAFLLVAFLLGVLSLTLSTVIAAPFNDALSEVIEQRLAGTTPAAFDWSRVLRDSVRSVRLESLKLACYACVMGPLFVVSWLAPGIGHGLYVVFGGLFTSAYFALDYIDWPASRRGHGIRQRLRLLRERPWLMLGFGGAVSLCMLIPFMNLWLMPAAVAGGTQLFLDVERASRSLRVE